jgi:hypothetical protein
MNNADSPLINEAVCKLFHPMKEVAEQFSDRFVLLFL